MTDLFGNPIEEPGTKQPAKPSLNPVSLPLQPLSPPARVDTPIRPIASVIREGQVTTIWNAALNPTTTRQTQP